jgi:hypothetical protein
MPIDRKEEAFIIDDFSGLIQRKTNRFQARRNEVWTAENAEGTEIGSLKKKLGYAIRGAALTTTTSSSTSTSTTTTSTSTSTTTSTSTSTSTS